MVTDRRVSDKPALGVSWRRVSRLAGWLLCGMFALAAPLVAEAQQLTPADAVTAYSAAFNAHDLPSALALFDQYGSATDVQGHHFEGSEGLADFLRSAGFADPNARITTTNLHVVANRAVWTYTCTCSSGTTEVRLVLNHNGISVFAEMPPAATPVTSTARSNALPHVWPVVVALGLLAGASSMLAFRRRQPPANTRPRQGRILAALAQSNARQHVVMDVPHRHGRD
jgi:SnoaL-like domain